MKNTPILQIAVACSLAAGALAQEAPPVLPGGSYPATAAEVGMLPDQKRAEATASRLEEGARNPFATRTKEVAGPVSKNTQSEEARIRAALDKFVLNGLARSEDGTLKAQLQGIILEVGELLPRVIEGQVDDLRVTKITPKLVEITWVGDEDAENPRQVTRAVDMTPKVAAMLPSPTGNGQLTIVQTQLPPELELEQQ